MEEQKLLRRRKKAQRDNNEGALISTCTELANLYMDDCRYDFAIEEYTTVADIYEKQKERLDYAIVNRGIGEAYLGLQQFDKALNHQKIYLDTARELNNKLEEQRALATIGHTYLTRYLDSSEPDKANLNSANKFFMKGLVVLQSLNDQASKLEVADMSARLFCNLGLVQDCLGDFKKASERITKSINLCKVHDLYEQLQRGYVALASVLVKREDHKSALQQYNLAAEAAKKLSKKPAVLAGILLSKSDVLVKVGDLRGAKDALYKAYKLKVPDVKEAKTIENNLRVVVAMNRYEDKLLSTESTDYIKLKSLYEKMGDGACDLKQFQKALDYYKKMLEAANKAEMTGSNLATCYYSLAETYKDNGQFNEAVAYFEQELHLCKNLKDSLNTLSKIADTKETARATLSEVEAVYNQAIESCQKEGNIHEEGRMVKRFIAYLRRDNHNSKAFQLEQRLSALDYHSSDSDSEVSDVQADSVIGADVDLSTISDVSDGSDVEQSPTKTRRRNKTFHIKKNIKGETQLHTACIKGQLNVVHHLLEQGHPANVRDHCGWLPLHEACINGHIEVVELLLEKGAAINDRGGTQCEGLTPLHDAASNGHLLVVQLLLNKGANAVAKTDEGDTVLDFLKKWRCMVQLDEENENLYESLAEQISQALEKAGHSTDVDHREKEVLQNTTPNKDMRRSAAIGLEDEDSLSPLNHHASGYRDVMESLRHRSDIKAPSKTSTMTKRSALMSADEMVEDWLEDDVGKTVKKRKTNSPRKSNSPAKAHCSRKSPSPVKSRFPRKSTDSGSFEDFTLIENIEPQIAPNGTTGRKAKSPLKSQKRKKQAKLTSFGHTRSFAEADSTSSPRTTHFESTSSAKLPRTHSFEPAQTTIDSTLFVDVRINKLYRVPVLLSQISTHTIKWLAEEAAARYARKEYMIPTLELETKNGAILADDDPLSLLFPMGATQAEEVEGRIIKWNVPPLTDRYKEASKDMSIAPREDICRMLQEFSVNLNLSNQGFKGTSLAPLCKVLNRQINLLELDLSGNFLTSDCFQFLGVSLASLENLHKLNLNCTGLQSEHIQVLVNSLSPGVSYKISDLDLSDNLLADRCLASLAVLSRRLQLKKFNLSGNNFTKNIFCHSFNQNLTLNFDQLEDFDVSDNELTNDTLVKILSWLHFPILKSLNVSRNSVTPGFLGKVLSNWTEDGNLKVCLLSRCHVCDADLFNLLRVSNSLETLDVSYNNDLTSISLRRLLQSEIVNLDLYGCSNILQYFTDFSKYLDESSNAISSRTITLSLPEKCDSETEYLIQMWKDLYGDRSLVELSSRFLSLSLLK